MGDAAYKERLNEILNVDAERIRSICRNAEGAMRNAGTTNPRHKEYQQQNIFQRALGKMYGVEPRNNEEQDEDEIPELNDDFVVESWKLFYGEEGQDPHTQVTAYKMGAAASMVVLKHPTVEGALSTFGNEDELLGLAIGNAGHLVEEQTKKGSRAHGEEAFLNAEIDSGAVAGEIVLKWLLKSEDAGDEEFKELMNRC